jgi:tail tube protein
MARAKGYQGIVGIRKAPTWGTAVACGAGHGVWVHSANVVANRGLIPQRSITGRPTQQTPDKGNLDVNGPLTFPLRYEGLGLVIASLLGTAGVPATVDTSARKHTFKIADHTDGLFWTLAYEVLKDLTIYEFNTLKAVGITLRWSNPGHAEMEVRTIGNDFTDASVINTTTTIDTVTMSANAEIAQARQVSVQMNAQGGAGLGGGDAVICTGGEVTIERPLQALFNSLFGDRSDEPEAPTDDAFVKVSGSLSFSNLQTGTGGNSTFVMEQHARTRKKAIVAFTGDNLAGAATEKYSHKLYFPDLVFGEGKPVLQAGALAWALPFTSHHVAAIPTGFPAGYVDAVTWENTNTITTDVLA